MSCYFLLLALAALFGLASSQGGLIPYCGGEGYDVSLLGTRDYSINVTGSTNYTYVIRPCGTVSNPLCSNSMFCQIPSGATGSYSLATYNSTTPATWIASTNSVRQIVQDGTYCGAIGAYRETTLVFVCNSAATTAYISSVKEVETCHYTAVFQTSLACNAVSLTGAQQIGETRASTICGAGVYDLSSLTTQDVVYNTNTSSATAGYIYTFRACGNVAQPNCTAYGPSMLCQGYKTGGAYLLATWNTSVETDWTVNSNGITMALQDGAYCGAIGANRESSINFVCDPSATTPVFQSLREVETCWYNAVILTNTVCTRIDTASSGSNSPSTSSGSNTPSTSSGVSSSTGSASPSNPSNGAVVTSSSIVVVAALAVIASLLL